MAKKPQGSPLGLFSLIRVLFLSLVPALIVLGIITDDGTGGLLAGILSIAAIVVDCLTQQWRERRPYFFWLLCLSLYTVQLVACTLQMGMQLPASEADRFMFHLPHRSHHHVSFIKEAQKFLPAAAAAVAAAQVERHQDELLPASEVPAIGDAASISVVLPCAEERENAIRTVERFCQRTPPERLAEIIVVDDGSSPPLHKLFEEDSRRLDRDPRCKVRFLRHEQTIGLMAAKQTGGKASVGDIIGFFDCHVAPQQDWHVEIVRKIQENPRRMVIPAITDLDMDTFDEKRDSSVCAKCYLTFDADFKWFNDESDYVPTISGGLAAVGRRWFNATGGFDEAMHGWGGENLDQSIRCWLCGGEIMRATSSRVAHMWRTGDRRTASHYRVKAKGTNNLGRFARAWYGPFLRYYRGHPVAAEEVRNFEPVKEALGCKPFSYFLYRFRRVYIEGGVIPQKVFQVRQIGTNDCFTSRNGVVQLRPCENDVKSNGGQAFHLGNVRPNSGQCCSGLRRFGTNDCLDYFDTHGPHFYSCDVGGQNRNQHYNWKEDGSIEREMDRRCLLVQSGSLSLGPCDDSASKFEQVNGYEPDIWLTYQEELAKQRWAELFPGLPDN